MIYISLKVYEAMALKNLGWAIQIFKKRKLVFQLEKKKKTHFVPFLYRWQRGTEAGIYFTIPYEPLLRGGKGTASASYSAKNKLSVESNVILYYN